jgi:hypothetical protein
MIDPSRNPEQSKGFMGSSLFKLMIAVLFVALGVYMFYQYKSKEDGAATEETSGAEATEEVVVEPEVPAAVEASEVPVLEATTIYEYRETGDTYTLIYEGGPGPYEFTCGMAATIKTSTTLAPQGRSSYEPGNMTDMIESTAWSEGRDGLGIGEWIEFTLTDEYKKWYPNAENFIENTIYGGFVIQTGYAKSPMTWKNNSRPIKLKAYLNSTALSIIQLRDTPDFQTFGIFPGQRDENSVRLKVGDVIRFEIIEVSRGSSTRDTDACISEFHIEGSCG